MSEPKSTFLPRQPRSSRGGATTVEFAVVVPIIFMMFLGSIELTRLNFIRQSAANVAYESARKAIVPGNTETDARTEATRLLSALGIGNGSTVAVTSTLTRITVTVTVPTSQNSWGISRFAGGTNIAQSCTLTRESVR